jgi:gliding motility-associated-like protein
VRDGCVYEKDVPMPIYTLMVPNVITPDEYPENNNFNVLYGGVAITTAQLKVELKIYNRWGKLIYENQNYNNDWAGANVEAGVYYYELKAENETTCKGWVSVLK